MKEYWRKPMSHENWLPRGEAPGPDAVLCPVCDVWLRSPQQYEEHLVGRKHRRNARALGAVGPTSDQRYWARYAACYHLQMLYTRFWQRQRRHSEL